jgi:hypothetical protein
MTKWLILSAIAILMMLNPCSLAIAADSPYSTFGHAPYPPAQGVAQTMPAPGTSVYGDCSASHPPFRVWYERVTKDGWLWDQVMR